MYAGMFFARTDEGARMRKNDELSYCRGMFVEEMMNEMSYCECQSEEKTHLSKIHLVRDVNEKFEYFRDTFLEFAARLQRKLLMMIDVRKSPPD